MKISKISSYIAQTPVTEKSAEDINREGWVIKAAATIDYVLVKVETEDGFVGWGDGFGILGAEVTKSAVDSIVAPQLIGKDATGIRALNEEMQRTHHLWGRYGAVMFAVSAIDIALWDIAGKRSQLPLCQLLGGPPKTVSAYASMIRYGSEEIAVAVAQQAVSEGFTAIKLHEKDDKVIRAVRESIDPEILLMNDANCPWGREEAISELEKVKDLDLFWYEEPVYPPEDYESIAKVKAATGVPIAAGEIVPSSHEFRRLLSSGAVTYAQPSVSKIGGVTEFLQVAALARAYNVQIMPHSPYFGPGFSATQHLMCALCPDSLLEWLYLPGIAENMPLTQSRPVSGKLQVSSEPGLGFADPGLYT